VKELVLAVSIIGVALIFIEKPIRKALRVKRYKRGRELSKAKPRKTRGRKHGVHGVSKASSRGHFLFAGTSGSGKSNLQKRLMKGPLRSIKKGQDRRALIYDAKGDMVAYLKRIGVSCPIYSLNPLEKRNSCPVAVSWAIHKDVTSKARAEGLAAKLIRSEGEGNNAFFVRAARRLVRDVIESLRRHAPDSWEFFDLVHVASSEKRIVEVLSRDETGRESLEIMMRDGGTTTTANSVMYTVITEMSRFEAVASLWRHAKRKLSIREWLKDDSILLFGSSGGIEEVANEVYGILFQMFVEEVDSLPDCELREILLWLDEVRLCGPVLKSKRLNPFTLKARSKGGVLVLGFQDIEGFREALGRGLANELIAQCSHKALLRMESTEGAEWAAKLLGQFETLEVRTSSDNKFFGARESLSEQRVMKDNVLPSEFFSIREPGPEYGVEGYFISPGMNPYQAVVPADEIMPVISSKSHEAKWRLRPRDESQQESQGWSIERRRELGLEVEPKQEKKKRLRLAKREPNQEKEHVVEAV